MCFMLLVRLCCCCCCCCCSRCCCGCWIIMTSAGNSSYCCLFIVSTLCSPLLGWSGPHFLFVFPICKEQLLVFHREYPWGDCWIGRQLWWELGRGGTPRLLLSMSSLRGKSQISGWVTAVRVRGDKCPGEGREVQARGRFSRCGQLFSGVGQVSKRCRTTFQLVELMFRTNHQGFGQLS